MRGRAIILVNSGHLLENLVHCSAQGHPVHLPLQEQNRGLITRKFAGIAHVSRATAWREIADLSAKGILRQNPGSGHSASYDEVGTGLRPGVFRKTAGGNF